MTKIQNVCKCNVVVSAPRITGRCTLRRSSNNSLTFTWASAKSATEYRLVGDGVDKTSSMHTITVDSLTPGTLYTFIVWAVGPRGLASNNITCVNSTGTTSCKPIHFARLRLLLLPALCYSNYWYSSQIFVS